MPEDLHTAVKKGDQGSGTTTTHCCIGRDSSHKGGSAGRGIAEDNQAEGNAAIPVDWKPQDKCYFCDEGKLLAVNDRGELVPESGSGNQPEPDLVNTVSMRQFPKLPAMKMLTFGNGNSEFQTPLDSDSDSSENYSDQGKPNLPAVSSKAVKDLLKNYPNMTSLESVMAAVASMNGLQTVPGISPFYSSSEANEPLHKIGPQNLIGDFSADLWYPLGHNLQQDGGGSSGRGGDGGGASGGDTNNVKASTSENSPSANAEQPLDLSAKSSSSSTLDQKNIFK